MKNLPSVRHSRGKEDPAAKRLGKINDSSMDVYSEEAKTRTDDCPVKCVYNYEDRYRFSRILSSDTLVFDSHFESGNLALANRVDGTAGVNQEYDLHLHTDLHSAGHNQWFYFSVSNTAPGSKVKFNIVNLGKPDSLYNRGMRPLMYSQADAAEGDREAGWRRCGQDIKYYCNHNQAPPVKGGRERGDRRYYTMTFTHLFDKSNDVVFFAMCYPYTYTDLQRYLYTMQVNDERNSNFRREVLCKTLAGNDCDLITVTEMNCKSPTKLAKRLGVVITARVHPGESNASWIMEGILDFLTSNCDAAKELRSKFVFKIVPMLNPDGVINGNYRTSLAGVDLNRRWDKPDCDLHPTIWSVKELLRRFQKTRTVILQTDIHGHSRKEGLFVYGCVPDAGWNRYLQDRERKREEKEMREELERRREKEKEEAGKKKDLGFGKVVDQGRPRSRLKERDGQEGSSGVGNTEEKRVEKTSGGTDAVKIEVEAGAALSEKLRARMFPRIFDSKSDTFIFSGCNFKVAKSKAKTMRVVMFDEFNIVCSYTLEASFSGLHGMHFCAADLKEMGGDFCESLRGFADYLEIESAATTRGLATRAATTAATTLATGNGANEEQFGFPLHDDDAGGGEGKNNDGVDLEESFAESLTEAVALFSPSSPVRDNRPLNDLMQQEMKYLTSKKFDDDGFESAGSDSDPSGDNFNEKELKKRMEGKKKKVRKKRAGRGKRLVRNSAGSRKSRAATPETNGGEGSGVAVGVKRNGVDRQDLKLPMRPPGKKTSRRSFTEGLYSKTPRAKSESEREMYAGDKGMFGARSRAQSANAGDRRASGCKGKNVSDPRFVMEGNVRVIPPRRSMRGAGLGGAANGTGVRRSVTGGDGNARGSFSKGDNLAVRVQQEIAEVRKDVMKNLDFRIGGISSDDKGSAAPAEMGWAPRGSGTRGGGRGKGGL